MASFEGQGHRESLKDLSIYIKLNKFSVQCIKKSTVLGLYAPLFISRYFVIMCRSRWGLGSPTLKVKVTGTPYMAGN